MTKLIKLSSSVLLFSLIYLSPANALNDEEISAEKDKMRVSCMKETEKSMQDMQSKIRDMGRLTYKICSCVIEDPSLRPYIDELTDINILKALPRRPADTEDRAQKANEGLQKASAPVITRCKRIHIPSHLVTDSDEAS